MWKKDAAAPRAASPVLGLSGQEQSTRRGEKAFPGIIRKRRCHNCSRRTYNYRCEACWAKIRDPEALDVTLFDDIVG